MAIRAAFVIGYTGDVTRFPTADHYASYNGTAPVEASSGGHMREDRPRPIPAPQAVLLAEVGECAGHPGMAPGVADAGVARQPVHPAVAGAGAAVLQLGDGLRQVAVEPACPPGAQPASS